VTHRFMEGRYNGCIMDVYSTIPGYRRLASIPKLSRRARQRLKCFDYYNSHNHNARLTCRYFVISPQTFYRWKRRYNPQHMETLEDHPHRPKRKPTYSADLVNAVLRLKEEYPGWGKDKLLILLYREGFACSASTAGRILYKLKERGVLKEPLPNHISARKSQRQGHYAVRKPKDYVAKDPGDMIEVANTEEFYEVTHTSFEILELNQALLKWQEVYNTIRPHQALGYLTPKEFPERYQQN